MGRKPKAEADMEKSEKAQEVLIISQSMTGKPKSASYMKRFLDNLDYKKNAPTVEELDKFLEKPKYQYLYQMPIEELKSRIKLYFDSITVTVIDAHTGVSTTKYTTHPGVYALANAIGFSKDTIMRYVKGAYQTGDVSGEREYGAEATEHCNALKKTFEIIRAYYENCLADNRNVAGAIFWMKNCCGWKDEQDIEIKPQENPLGKVKTEKELEAQIAPPKE